MPDSKIPRVVASQSGQIIPAPPFVDERKESRQSPPKNKPKARKPQRYTLAEALNEAFHFRCDGGRNTLDLEKSIRCVGYLLEWTSESGNVPSPPTFAAALAEVLSKCADEVRTLFTRDDIYYAGGNPILLLNKRSAEYGEKNHEPRNAQ